MRIFMTVLLLAVIVVSGPAVAQASGWERSQAASADDKKYRQPVKPTKGDEVAKYAIRYKGVPYKFGGASSRGFDCSGFVWYVFNKNGNKLPRTADKQYETGKPISFKELRPGDVVFFTTYEKGASHCGIYMGAGKFIHASSSRGVTVTSLADAYWKQRYLGARRML